MPASSFQTDVADRPKAATRKLGVRTKVPGEKGLYERWTTDGLVHDINYTDRTGKLRWEVVYDHRRTVAKRRRAELVSRRPEERRAPSRELFDAAAEAWYETKRLRLRPRTQRLYRDALNNLLLPKFGRVRLTRIDADAVSALTRELQEVGLHCVDPSRPIRPLGRSSVENYLKPLQGVLALAARRGWIESSPFAVLLPDDRPRDDEERPPEYEWKPEDLVALVEASARLAAQPTSRYDYSALLTAASTLGPRLGECLGWTWADFDKDANDGAGVLHIRRQWLRTGEYGPTKTPAAVRVLPLPPELRDLLIALRLRSRYSADADPIFASHTGKPLGHWNVPARGFVPARDLAGLPSSVTFHCLRDAAASRLINAGLDPVAVATFLGHEDATTTLRKYARLFDRRRTGDAVRSALAGVVGSS